MSWEELWNSSVEIAESELQPRPPKDQVNEQDQEEEEDRHSKRKSLGDEEQTSVESSKLYSIKLVTIRV